MSSYPGYQPEPAQQPYGQPQHGNPPQYGAPQYGNPQSGGQQYGAPQYPAGPQYGAPPPYGQQPGPYGQQPGYPPQNYGPPRVPQELLAGWGTRVYSALVDGSPGLLLAVLAIVAVLAESPTLLAIVLGVGYLALFAFAIWNSCYRQGTTGQSLGKQVAGTKLVSAQSGQPIGFGNAFVRQLAHILDGFFFIGYLWPLWDDQKQTFADKVCSTVVVKV